jgi:hypothetical protein
MVKSLRTTHQTKNLKISQQVTKTYWNVGLFTVKITFSREVH